MRKATIALLFALLLASTGATADSTSIWHVRLDMNWLGPAEFHLHLEKDADTLHGRSLSGAVPLLQELPGEHEIDAGLMAFSATRASGNSYSGQVIAPWQDGDIRLEFDGDRFEGAIDGGAFSGKISGNRVESGGKLRDYVAIVEALDDVVASRLFSPADLAKLGYRAFRENLSRIAAAATDDLDLLFGFHWAWQNDPFSHFQLKRSAQNAAELFAFFDSYRVGFEAATLEFDGDVAILAVKTMMGADTIEQIRAAYDRISAASPAALIIDLRGNGGGAFAVKPLVEHVIDRPVDAGYFLSQVWNRQHARLPTRAEVLAASPWSGWSITAFWKSVQETEILRVQFRPAKPNYDGPVFVLLDDTSASATELAADAFRSSGVTTLIGKRSAGQMLSQSMFDVAEGFVVSLPVADYFSMAHGRIEGQGVPVDVETDQALGVAKRLAREAMP